MMGNIRRAAQVLCNRRFAVCLFLFAIVLSLWGIRWPSVGAALGIALCVVGFVSGAVTVDLWVFIPLAAYNVYGFASAYAAYGTIMTGYASTQMYLPLIYLVTAYLCEEDLSALRRMWAIAAGAIALLGIAEFLYSAMGGGAVRMSGVLGNPNQLGIFLTVGYFAYTGACDENGGKCRVLVYLEPVFFIAIALTLSMGSFVAMTFGMAVLFLAKLYQSGLQKALRFGCYLIAKAVIGFGLGFLLYIAAARIELPALCIALFAYLTLFVLFWRQFEAFLHRYKNMAAAIAVSSLLLAAVAVIIRPNSIETFAERLEMMRNGIGYMVQHPVFGVGPYRWRQLNFLDSDTYFNVNHIHNSFIHAGTEFGIPAMLLLVAVAVRIFVKKDKYPPCRAAGVAFAVHNLIDAAFFNITGTSMMLMVAAEPQKGGTRIGNTAARVIFAVFAAILAYHLYWYILT